MGPNIKVGPMDSSLNVGKSPGGTPNEEDKEADRMTVAPSVVQKAEPEPSEHEVSDSVGGEIKSISSAGAITPMASGEQVATANLIKV